MFYDKIDFSIRMRVMYNLKHRYPIRSKVGDKFLTSLFKLVLEAKGSIYSTIQENLLPKDVVSVITRRSQKKMLNKKVPAKDP